MTSPWKFKNQLQFIEAGFIEVRDDEIAVSILLDIAIRRSATRVAPK
jgi:hypothetical protein